MKTKFIKRRPSGFISYLMVLTTATLLSVLSIYAYRRAMTSHKVESQVQMRIDYSEKEEAVLRSIVAIVPNRAIGAMKPNSAVAATAATLSWAGIFNEALVMGNSRASIPANLARKMGLPATARRSNTGDSTVAASAAAVFTEILPPNPLTPALVSVGSAMGTGRFLGAGYPPLLNFQAGVAATNDSKNDGKYPIISNTKQYGVLAGTAVRLVPGITPGRAGISPGYESFKHNLVPYPQINFNYCKPGEDFVTKRNWWAFSLNVGNQDAAATKLGQVGRDFVLSIYEIPSQLAISSAAATQLGTSVDAGDWTQNRVSIDGGVSTGRSVLGAPANAATATAISSLAARGGMNVAAGAVVGGLAIAPSALGDRENYQNSQVGVKLDNQMTLGAFYPVSLSSDSGRCAFVPISVGDTFYDRYMQPDPGFDKYRPNPANASLSSTAWSDYSIGARQCAMQLDITAIGLASVTPRDLSTYGWTFSYLVGGLRIPVPIGITEDDTPPGYIRIRSDGGSFDCGNTPTDFAFGTDSRNMRSRSGLRGNVVFNDLNFPGVVSNGRIKYGFILSAFEPMVSETPITSLGVSHPVKIWPKRFPMMLAALGADPAEINNSLVVNVAYAGPAVPIGPRVPPAPVADTAINSRYRLILDECDDLTIFPKGFSLVTNMNLNVADDFNSVGYSPASLPAGYVPLQTTSNPTGVCSPATSLFAPSSDYGITGAIINNLNFSGQRNSLRVDQGGNTEADRVKPLESKQVNGAAIPAARLTMNLSKMRHPVEIPPVTMMNWLIVLEERRREYGGLR